MVEKNVRICHFPYLSSVEVGRSIKTEEDCQIGNKIIYFQNHACVHVEERIPYVMAQSARLLCKGMYI